MPVISASKKLFNINLTILRLPVTMQVGLLQNQFHEDIIALCARTFSFYVAIQVLALLFNNLYVWLRLSYYLCPLRIEGETGSAEEQPASNKSLRYTVTI